ncbi:MAG: hypothetical protein A2857_01080 [Candidatus Levybacteria bacterium RIFCSPHIGHO2_01_FULL_36_15]|nr:MAG: hypothetical protein A2857_01080 [Candidatus Levybacteria bacterium RIFCSPHIGHO2_01_FULL_36_15]
MFTKFLRIILTFLFIVNISTKLVLADSNYVLPYPSFMPGTTYYRLHILWETIMKYWYFGSFAQFKYNLKLSDKYLVEAKTLFEYKQYLLGYKALEKSDLYFSKTHLFLKRAKEEKKNTGHLQDLLRQAALKHTEVLESVSSNIPPDFVWISEKSSPTVLNLEKSIKNSIQIRKKII